MKFGDRIAHLRTKKKLTQAELAKRIGITRASLSHYEKNRREPDYETLKRIADFFDVSTDYILGRDKDIETIAAHHEDYEWTQEELEEIELFKEFMRNKRNQ